MLCQGRLNIGFPQSVRAPKEFNRAGETLADVEEGAAVTLEVDGRRTDERVEALEGLWRLGEECRAVLGRASVEIVCESLLGIMRCLKFHRL